ncbi:MAG TPA: NAD(P)/FAD-dependent oxidoreductase [Hyphomonadaceae bacterium]|nr:NAD(P)/FAD-dependent oxidoreductase [Hyphomonadaceae bacterium]
MPEHSGAEHFDVVIVGAGLSGIGAAYHLKTRLPGKTYAILEGRHAIGGTWDLFRYPGIRSDSDMYTLGYAFKPWPSAKAIADGPSIRSYVRETAAENGIDKHIRFGHHVVAADWSGKDARWTVTTEKTAADGKPTGERASFTCSFIMMCSGYYRYEQGYTPDFPGRETFKGKLIHPQHWPEDLDHAGKDVVVIGSGATAVTIVPEMAKTARHVTMLQRSPSYVVARPSEDAIANWLKSFLPAKMAYNLIRWKNVSLGQYFYARARKKPEAMRAVIAKAAQKQLGPDYPVSTHFNPKYNPWDQRMCLIPDADLFNEIKAGHAEVVTDTIDRFTPGGIKLNSGKELKADIIVTATGLDLLFLGGTKVSVDGKEVEFGKTTTYKGMMYSGVPNLVSIFGYTNASWTLKCDLTCEYTCRIIAKMDSTGAKGVTPTLKDGNIEHAPWLDFSSGYVQRTIDRFPKQGTRMPWKLNQNYRADVKLLRYGAVEDPELVFS